MPLQPGNSRAAISNNIHELSINGSRPRSHAQIVAIALSNADKHPHKAGGGGIGHFASGGAAIPDIPFHSGLIPGSGGGRTDRIPLSVASNSHVIPSDATSAPGQDVTSHGAKVWEAALATAPWGVAIPKPVHGHGPPSAPHGGIGFAGGGTPQRVSILAASGELIVPPHDVEALGERGIRAGLGKRGESAMDCGHRLIDEAIDRIRKWKIEWLKHAKPPKR